MGDRIGNFVTRLEQRADISLVRYGIAPTTYLAKKLINSNFVFHGNKLVKNSHSRIKLGTPIYVSLLANLQLKLNSFLPLMRCFEKVSVKTLKRRTMYRQQAANFEHAEKFSNIDIKTELAG